MFPKVPDGRDTEGRDANGTGGFSGERLGPAFNAPTAPATYSGRGATGGGDEAAELTIVVGIAVVRVAREASLRCKPVAGCADVVGGERTISPLGGSGGACRCSSCSIEYGGGGGSS